MSEDPAHGDDAIPESMGLYDKRKQTEQAMGSSSKQVAYLWCLSQQQKETKTDVRV